MSALSSEDDVYKVARKLEKMSKGDTVDAAAVTEQIKLLRSFKMTLDVLQRTRIGLIINAVRKKTSDQECSQLARGLIKSWKKLLPASGDGPEPEEESVQASQGSELANGAQSDSLQEADRKSDSSDKPSNGNKGSQNSCEPLKQVASSQNDPTRQRCGNLILEAIRFGATEDCKSDNTCSEVEEARLSSLASDLEDAIYADIRKTDERYKNRVRSRVMNLRDKKNKQLRQAFLIGAIMPEQLAKMSPEEMASDELKSLRQKFTQESINDAQMAFTGGTVTSHIKCNRCGKNNCTYNQVQTRSADEPMTTFVLCNECGRRWKFC